MTEGSFPLQQAGGEIISERRINDDERGVGVGRNRMITRSRMRQSQEGRALRQFTLSTGKSAGRNSSGCITVFHRGHGMSHFLVRISIVILLFTFFYLAFLLMGTDFDLILRKVLLRKGLNFIF